MFSRLLLSGSIAALLATSATSQAQDQVGGETPSDVDEAARLLYENGTAAFEAGDFDEARRRYETAYELSHRPELLFNIATCHDRLDQKEEAIVHFERFLEERPDSPNAPGVRTRIDVLRRSLASESESETQATDESSPSLAGPIAAFAVGGAGLVTFAVSGLIAKGRYDDADSECLAEGCDEDALSAVTRGALIADIGLGVAIAGALTGVVWLLVGAKKSSSPESAIVAPSLRRDGGGVSIAGRF